MTTLRCPSCGQSLRVPTLRDLVALELTFQGADLVEGVMLRCKFCGAMFGVAEGLECGELPEARDD